jgi:hypothetical protein
LGSYSTQNPLSKDQQNIYNIVVIVHKCMMDGRSIFDVMLQIDWIEWIVVSFMIHGDLSAKVEAL